MKHFISQHPGISIVVAAIVAAILVCVTILAVIYCRHSDYQEECDHRDSEGFY